MGNFEKMVVLAVLFLSAIVLAVSLNDDGNEVEATGPLSAAAQRLEEPSRTPLPGAVDPGTKTETAHEQRKGPDYFLFGEVKSPEPAPEASGPLSGQREGAGSRVEARQGPIRSESRILRSIRGLKPSALDDYRVYDVVEGDTWNGLAVRFYGDGSYSSNLRMANEGGQLRSGSPILVPVYDFGQEALSGRPPLAPEVAPAAPAVVPAAPTAPASPASIGELYTVQNGDSLSRIAAKAYGNGNLWRLIYDANREQMRSADWVQVGMKLVIPDPEQAARVSATEDPEKPRVR